MYVWAERGKLNTEGRLGVLGSVRVVVLVGRRLFELSLKP